MYFTMMKKSKQLIQKQRDTSAIAIIETEDANKTIPLTQSFKHYLRTISNRKHAYVGGGALIVGSFFANVLNYIFSAYLGRILTFSDFALIGLMSSFLSFAGILFGAYTFTLITAAVFLLVKKETVQPMDF